MGKLQRKGFQEFNGDLTGVCCMGLFTECMTVHCRYLAQRSNGTTSSSCMRELGVKVVYT